MHWQKRLLPDGLRLQIKSNEDPYKGFLVCRKSGGRSELVILRHVPTCIITVTSEKTLHKAMEGTKHTVKYRWQEACVGVRGCECLNSTQPKSMVQKMNKKISQTVVEVTNNVTEGLEDWLKRKGAEADEVEEALGIVEEELTK